MLLYFLLALFPWPQALLCSLKTPPRNRRRFFVRSNPVPVAAGTFFFAQNTSPWPQALLCSLTKPPRCRMHCVCSLKTRPRGRMHFLVRLQNAPVAACTFVFA